MSKLKDENGSCVGSEGRETSDLVPWGVYSQQLSIRPEGWVDKEGASFVSGVYI